jgi:hypothetical protein
LAGAVRRAVRCGAVRVGARCGGWDGRARLDVALAGGLVTDGLRLVVASWGWLLP